MTKIILYIAISQDGFIADEKGSVDWLPQTTEETGGQDYGYQEFYNSIDALAIGRKTYEQILSFGPWPYPGKQSYVFSSKSIETSNPDVKYVSGTISGFIQDLEKRNVKNLWLVGGSELADAFYNQGRIDEFILTVFPKVLKKGIPLKTLSEAIKKDQVIKVHTTDFGGGVYQENFMSIQPKKAFLSASPN